MKTTHGRPALAAKAAAEAPALPEELETTTLAPKRLAIVTAPEPSRSLNDQVGLRDSSLIQTSPRPSDGAGRSGVLPSPRVTASAAEAWRKPSQRHIEPRSRRMAARSVPIPGTVVVDHTEVGGRAPSPAGRAVLGIVVDGITGAATNAGKRRGYRHGAATLAFRDTSVNRRYLDVRCVLIRALLKADTRPFALADCSSVAARRNRSTLIERP